MSAASRIIPLLRADELDRLADDYELAAAISPAGGTQTRDWPQTVRDLVVVAYCFRDVARRLRDGGRL